MRSMSCTALRSFASSSGSGSIPYISASASVASPCSYMLLKERYPVCGLEVARRNFFPFSNCSGYLPRLGT